MNCYQARITENGESRTAMCDGRRPLEALYWVVKECNVRKGATVQLGYAMWVGATFETKVTTYRHMPEEDLSSASVWELVGSDIVSYILAKPQP